MSFDANNEDTPAADAFPAAPDAVNATDVLSEHLQKPRRRFKSSRNAPRKTMNVRIPAWLTAVCAFVLGATLGVLVMRQRHAADKVVVTVNSETIGAQDFYARLEAVAGPQVLRQMVAESLTRQYAQERHLLPTPAEIQSKAEQISAQAAFASAAPLASAAPRPPTPDEARQMAQAQSLQEKLVAQGVDVTDAEAHAYYREQTDPHNPTARFLRPEAVRMAVIVTPSEAQARQAENALCKGTPFVEVAKTYSKDRSASRGGEMPPILRGRTLARQVRGLEDVIFGLQPGETTRPQKLMGAWWIMRCEEKTPAQTLPFAQVQAQCRREARLVKAQRAQGTQVEADFEKYCRSVSVQVFWQRYAATVLNQEHKLTPGKL